jgi:hypothetical protein
MLALPASAAPRDRDEPPLMQRIVRVIRHVVHLVTIADDQLSIPRP